MNANGAEVSECRFEYGTSTSYGHMAPCEQTVGAGSSEVAVSRHVEGLSANVTYYWRLAVVNGVGTSSSVDQTFVYDTSGESLPDDRAYEMVTPPLKDGALIGSTFSGVRPEISADGSRLIATSIQCFAGSESCSVQGSQQGEQFLFSRTSAGWVTTALAAPASQFEVSNGLMGSAETGSLLLGLPTMPASEDDIYVHKAGGPFVDIGPVTPPTDGANGLGGLGFTRATSDFSHVAYQQSGSLWPFVESRETTLEYSGTGNATPALVGVTGGPGSTSLISKCDTVLGVNSATPGIMSADGEIVYFTAEPCESGTGLNASTPVPVPELFARVGGARTVAVSEPQALTPGPREECKSSECMKNTELLAKHEVNPSWRGAEFQGASADGSRVFFTSEQQLTDQASQDEGQNLYESECSAGCEGPESEEKRSLTDVSAIPGGGKHPGGTGLEGVMGISGDGSHIYFIASTVLTQAPNAQGATAREGASNLYVFERDAEHPAGLVEFATQLPESDAEYQWGSSEKLANVTPDGRFLVFESHGDLTPDATRTDGAWQIYRYDAQTGQLARISIGQDGFNDNGNLGVGDARIVQSGLGVLRAGAARLDPTMSDDGSFVFFESPVGLTPHAVNDLEISSTLHEYEKFTEPHYAENVYEWHEGHVYLISDGRDAAGVRLPYCRESATCLIGSDATGHNVFFFTADALSASDTDTQVDVYDARICTSKEPCISQPLPPLAPCLGEACHGTPAEQLAPPGGGTLAFNGPGNAKSGSPSTRPASKSQTRAERLAKSLRTCQKKHSTKRRRSCEAAARKSYGARSAGKPSPAKSHKGGK